MIDRDGEALVTVVGSARPDLELRAVGRRTVRHVCSPAEVSHLEEGGRRAMEGHTETFVPEDSERITLPSPSLIRRFITGFDDDRCTVRIRRSC